MTSVTTWRGVLLDLNFQNNDWRLTKILPVVVWPDISSPAQSLASVTHPISVSGPFNPGFWGLPGFCTVLAFLWQQSHAKIRHDKTRSNQTKNVIKLEQRKAYQCLSSRHNSSAVFTVTLESGILAIQLHSSIQKIRYFSIKLSKNMLSNILSASISTFEDVGHLAAVTSKKWIFIRNKYGELDNKREEVLSITQYNYIYTYISYSIINGLYIIIHYKLFWR